MLMYPKKVLEHDKNMLDQAPDAELIRSVGWFM